MAPSSSTVDKVEARKYLKSLIHQDGALFWSEDLGDDDSPVDELIDILPEYRDLCEFEDEEDEEEPVVAHEGREPIWSLHLKLSGGKECNHIFYNQMHQEPLILYEELKAFFVEDI